MSHGEETAQIRMPYVARCELRSDEGVAAGIVCNLSRHGCFVHVDPVPNGEFDLLFPLPDGGPPVGARASIRWVNAGGLATAASLPAGCGVRFAVMPPEDRRRVEAVVEAFHRTPDLPVGAEAKESPAVRVPILVRCTLTGEFGEARGTTCNLSMFGVYVAVEPIPPLGAKVWASLELPRKRTAFEIWATVTWRNEAAPSWETPLPPGCGLCFEGVSMLDMRYLARLVEEHLAERGAGAG